LKDIYLVINKNNDSKINPQIYYLDFDFINGPKLYNCPFNEDGTPNFDNGEEVIADIGDFSNKYFYESVTKKLYDLWKNYLMLTRDWFEEGDNDEKEL
tara:strand:+ start:759 stop:1052 length:294 start_codon:yes stop_codon:yes gene_type:complete